MSKLHLLTEEQSMSNKAWTLLNANLNAGVEWNEAKVEAELDAEKMKLEYDQNFQVDESDPLRSEKVWEKSMSKFDNLIKTIRNL